LKLKIGDKWEELASETVLECMRWYHIAGTYEQLTGKMVVYVNGKVNAEKKVGKGDIVQSGKDIQTGKDNSMKRSEINRIINEMKELCGQHCFMLPPWAFWSLQDWKSKADTCREIVNNGLGWDVTDFGSGNFDECGLTLFTLRNGNVKSGHPKTYAEKIMMVRERQVTPFHFHWHKMEDIIVRGGGNMVFELRNSVSDVEYNDEPVSVSIDGIKRIVEAGSKLVLQPGQSICLQPLLFHRFYAEPGSGTSLVGEVSQVNEDATDNNFYGGLPRFPDIEEDEAPLYLLCTDYQQYI
jgi:D-lyxose ketol-isomerase